MANINRYKIQLKKKKKKKKKIIYIYIYIYIYIKYTVNQVMKSVTKINKSQNSILVTNLQFVHMGLLTDTFYHVIVMVGTCLL